MHSTTCMDQRVGVRRSTAARRPGSCGVGASGHHSTYATAAAVQSNGLTSDVPCAAAHQSQYIPSTPYTVITLNTHRLAPCPTGFRVRTPLAARRTPHAAHVHQQPPGHPPARAPPPTVACSPLYQAGARAHALLSPTQPCTRDHACPNVPYTPMRPLGPSGRCQSQPLSPHTP